MGMITACNKILTWLHFVFGHLEIFPYLALPRRHGIWLSFVTVMLRPSATLPWAPRARSSKERSAVLRREQRIRRGWSHWSWSQRCSWGEKPIVTCELKACMLQINESVTSLFHTSSPVKRSFASTTMWKINFWRILVVNANFERNTRHFPYLPGVSR